MHNSSVTPVALGITAKPPIKPQVYIKQKVKCKKLSIRDEDIFGRQGQRTYGEANKTTKT